MNRVEQKRVARHIRSVNTRHDKFIAAYIKAKYPEPFAEAKAFYEKLNNKYATKRDLTKTDEFLVETTKYSSAYDMYRSRYETKMKEKNQQKDTMALEIPLMNQEQVDIAIMEEKVDPSLAIPEDVYQSLVRDLCQDPAMAMFFKENTEEEQPNQIDEQVNKLLQEVEDILPQIFDQTELEKELEQ